MLSLSLSTHYHQRTHSLTHHTNIPLNATCDNANGCYVNFVVHLYLHHPFIPAATNTRVPYFISLKADLTLVFLFSITPVGDEKTTAATKTTTTATTTTQQKNPEQSRNICFCVAITETGE